MYQRDFILRLIEQIAQFIARLLKLQQEEKLDVAYDFLVNQATKVTGVSYHEFLKMSIDDFKKHLVEKTITASYLDTLGRYFSASGELCLGMKKDEEAIHHLEMAVFCFSEAEHRFSTFSFNRQVDIEKLNQLRLRAGLN